MPRRRFAALLAFAALVAGSALLPTTASGAPCSSPQAMPPLTFGTPKIVDAVRAGGEPSVQGLPDGSLLYSAHAGTTHIYKSNMPDPDFFTPYEGSDYVWRSADGGATWSYIGVAGTGAGPHAGPGFSDPAFAVDKVGNVYVAGIDLSNVYVAKSSDSGQTWLGNPVAALITDREWLAADEANVVYMNGNEERRGRMLWKSTDGGVSWNFSGGVKLPGSGPPSPMTVDQSDGRLYFPMGDGGNIAVYPSARSDTFTPVVYGTVPGGLPHVHGFLNPLAVDAAGNAYVVSNTDKTIKVSYSTDRGLTWTTNTIHSGTTSVLWPWVSAGADGRVAVSWLQSDTGASDNSQAHGNFRVYSAQSITGHGWTDTCNAKQPPVYEGALSSSGVVHSGEICQQGLSCNVSIGPSSDRRLGDYLTNSLTADGRLVVAYATTTFKPSGAIAHPAFVAETGGLDFFP